MLHYKQVTFPNVEQHCDTYQHFLHLSSEGLSNALSFTQKVQEKSNSVLLHMSLFCNVASAVCLSSVSGGNSVDFFLRRLLALLFSSTFQKVVCCC